MVIQEMIKDASNDLLGDGLAPLALPAGKPSIFNNSPSLLRPVRRKSLIQVVLEIMLCASSHVCRGDSHVRTLFSGHEVDPIGR